MDKKPLGMKSYGSIAHLPGSKRGPADHGHSDKAAYMFTDKTKEKNDRIIIQEKLDGSNVSVAKINGKCVALGRSGYLAQTSPYEQHQLFAKWVSLPRNYYRFDKVLKEGERLCGEWLIQAHGTKYKLHHEPFVAFDLMMGPDRVVYSIFILRIIPIFETPFKIGIGFYPKSIEEVMEYLKRRNGYHGAIDPVEGAVWRLERGDRVLNLAKYVRPDKEDGKYLEGVTGKGPIWNVDIKELLK